MFGKSRCVVEERDLCFVCYRSEHLEGKERLWHRWETSKAFTCQVCAQRDVTVVCSVCADKSSEGSTKRRTGSGAGRGESGGDGGLMLCDSCWERTHAHQDVRHHEGLTIDRWAGRNRKGEGVSAAGGERQEGGRGLLEAETAPEQRVALVETTADWGEEGAGAFGYGEAEAAPKQQVALVETVGGGEDGAWTVEYGYADGAVAREYTGAEQYGHEPYETYEES